jgi:hypothetical protein
MRVSRWIGNSLVVGLDAENHLAIRIVAPVLHIVAGDQFPQIMQHRRWEQELALLETSRIGDGNEPSRSWLVTVSCCI